MRLGTTNFLLSVWCYSGPFSLIIDPPVCGKHLTVLCHTLLHIGGSICSEDTEDSEGNSK